MSERMNKELKPLWKCFWQDFGALKKVLLWPPYKGPEFNIQTSSGLQESYIRPPLALHL